MPPIITHAVLLILSLCYSFAGQTQQKLDSLLRAKEKLSLDTTRVLISIQIGHELWRANQPEKSITELTKAQAEAIQLNFKKGEGLSLLHQGIATYRLSEFSKASTLFINAIALLEKQGTKADLSMACHWAGNTFYKLSQYDKSLTYYLKALKIREELQDEAGIAFTQYNIANIYFEQKQFATALDFHTRSLEIKKQLNDKRSIAFSYNNLGNIYTELQDYEKALDYYRDAHAIFKELNNNEGLAYALGNMGKVYMKQQLYTKAMESLRSSIKILEALDDKTAVSEAHNVMAEVYTYIHQYDVALSHLQKSDILATETQNNTQLIANYLAHARLDSARGNMAAAFAWYKKYTQLKETIFNSEKSKQLTEMQALFDVERKNQEIETLNNEKNLLERLRQNQQILFAVIIGAFVILIAGLVYFLNQKQKTNLKLEEQKKHAEELNQLNHKLFSIISHDLKEPLNSLKGVLELASDQMITEKELAPLLSAIGDNTQHIIDLLNNLLNWAKSHLRGEPVVFAKANLTAITENVIKLLQPMANRKNIQVINQLPETLEVTVNKNMIELVIRNLISNAIKFTNHHGTVTLYHELEKDNVIIAIQDTGIGLKPEILKQLFSTQTVTTRGTADERGTGLGLILCREFVEQHSGKIWATSNYSKGSIFSFTLPLA
jgi:two-component system, sensor histidine kinase and response regulator